MSTPTYDVDYFIAKFEAIPEERWFVGDFRGPDGRCCALGHCGLKTGYDTAEALALDFLLEFDTVAINDGDDSRYNQPTPKQRIMAALRDVKGMAK